MATPEKEQNQTAEHPKVADVVTQLAKLDSTPWYKKPNLRLLYLLMFPTCIGVEMTSGYGDTLSVHSSACLSISCADLIPL